MNWAQVLTPSVLAPGGLIALTVVLVLTGRLVPWQRVKELKAEVEHQRVTIDSLTKSVGLYAAAVEAQTQTSEIVKTVIGALQEEHRESGGMWGGGGT